MTPSFSRVVPRYGVIGWRKHPQVLLGMDDGFLDRVVEDAAVALA